MCTQTSAVSRVPKAEGLAHLGSIYGIGVGNRLAARLERVSEFDDNIPIGCHYARLGWTEDRSSTIILGSNVLDVLDYYFHASPWPRSQASQARQAGSRESYQSNIILGLPPCLSREHQASQIIEGAA